MGRPTEDLGFAGMLLAGVDPDDAYERICSVFDRSGAAQVLERLRESEAGRDTIAYLERRWATHGYPAPWNRSASQH